MTTERNKTGEAASAGRVERGDVSCDGESALRSAAKRLRERQPFLLAAERIASGVMRALRWLLRPE